MAHLQYMPGDPRLVDQLVYELKSKGIFDQFRKECIADVDTRPAYQNLRQRVENSVSTFLSRQCWKPDLNKNQLREKLRKHILDGNYLEQGVERIVDQVVNPKVASVFIPQVEDLVYNYLGISRKKSIATAETSNGKVDNNLLPTDLEAVSPGSVKSNDDKDEMDTSEVKEDTKMNVEEEEKPKAEINEESSTVLESVDKEKIEGQDTQLSGISDLTSHDSDVSMDKSTIPLPAEEIKLENIPPPDNSPPKVELEKIELPKEPNLSTDIPLPDEIHKDEKEHYFKPINSDDDDSSSDSSLRRNMSPLTPIRNFNNENSCDAQQAFENDLGDSKSDGKKEPSSFRFAIETKSPENSSDVVKTEKKDRDQSNLAYQFNNQVNINAFNTPVYEDSSNSNNLRIDYESDANSKTNIDVKVPDIEQNSNDSKKEQKTEEKKSSSKSSHRSRDSHRYSSSSKDRRSESKHSSSRDRKDTKYDKKPPKEDGIKSKSGHRERSRDRSERKDSRDSSKHRSSSHKSSSHKDSKSHRSSSSSQRHSSKQSDEKKSSSSYHKDKTDKSSDKNTKESKSKDSKSHRSDKDRKSSSKSKNDDKDKDKKEKKETDDHYSLSGRGNNSRRSTDRDSNDGSSSSKGSHNQPSSKSMESKKENKDTSSKSDHNSTSNDSTGPSDRDQIVNEADSDSKDVFQPKPIVRVETHLETPISTPPRLSFVPEVTLKKPRFAANLEEAKKLMKMRKFLDEEQKRMNQEAALLLEFQANVRPSLSQVYSNIPGPELEFACITTTIEPIEKMVEVNQDVQENVMQEMATNEEEEYPTELNNETHNDNDILDKNTEVEYENTEQVTTEQNTTTESSFETVQHEEESRKRTEFFEVTIITEEVSENEENEYSKNEIYEEILQKYPDEHPLKYFAEHEKYNAELERENFIKFFKAFNEKVSTNKMYLINCDTYEENIFKEVSKNFGQFEIINYYKNGHLKLPKVAKNINLATEITLPIDKSSKNDYDLSCVKSSYNSPMFSPVKSECSFELSSDYDAKLEEMVNKTSRQEIMEIILGGAITGESPSKMPRIDYCVDSNIDIVEDTKYSLKRRLDEVESTDNNNRHVLTPKKMRKLSGSDQISSTTEETNERPDNNRMPNNIRSKYFGKARRVGLPRPRKSNLPNSPSSDKSVENYEQNTQVTSHVPNGKIKSNSPRSKVQRYDTSDLYKPKLHYLSRRNNIS